MEFDFTTLASGDRYRLLTSFVVPRPIALVTTRAVAGNNNAAPMSFFNVFSQDPPILILGIQGRAAGFEKDTLVNIRRTGDFVVNMVDRALGEAMVICGVGFAGDVDELKVAGLTPVPALKVDAARIAQSPCSMECRVERIIDFPNRAIVLGQVVQMSVRNDCLDNAGRYVVSEVFQPIARLHADNYIGSDRQFVLRKPAEMAASEAEWLAGLVQ